MPKTTFEDITYNSEKNLGTLESKIYWILEGKGDQLGFDSAKDLVRVNEKLSFYRLGLSNYLLESDDQSHLNSLKEALGLQGVTMLGDFNRNGKNYLILYKSESEGGITTHLFADCNVKLIGIL